MPYSRLLLLSILALTGLCACSSTKGKMAGKLNFKTLITEDGAKRFELNHPRPEQSVSLTTTRSQQRNPYRDELSDKQLERLVANILHETGYCRKGHILLGRHAGQTTGKVRGECNEVASAADRAQFPNTIQSW